MNNNNKRYEFITSFTPSIMLLANRPRFQLAAAFRTRRRVRTREQPNDASSPDFHPGTVTSDAAVRFTATETFLRTRARTRLRRFQPRRPGAWSNTFDPAVGWQLQPRTGLDVGASYSVLRFEGQGHGDRL